jgi:hypothetical protein
MLPDLLKGIDLKALIDEAAWRRFVWDGVTRYWTSGNNSNDLNRILAAAKALQRYQAIVPTLIKVSAHALDLRAGIFVNGVNKKLSNQLADQWRSNLADLISVPGAAASPTPPASKPATDTKKQPPQAGTPPPRTAIPQRPLPTPRPPNTTTRTPAQPASQPVRSATAPVSRNTTTNTTPRQSRPAPSPPKPATTRKGRRITYIPPKPAQTLARHPGAVPSPNTQKPKTDRPTHQPPVSNPPTGPAPIPSAPATPTTIPKKPPPIINRLSGMPISETVKLWKNCIDYLNDEKYRDRWEVSRLVIDAIYREWQRRNAVILKDNDYFKWPDIDAVGGNGTLATNWLAEGLLSYMGYHVGNTQGVVTGKRRKILTEVFCGPVPPLFPRYYLEEWGVPSSAHRLRKLAETLASFIRNAKRRHNSDSLAKAIDQWTDDLEYLYLDYYVDKFHFAWPTTEH